MTGTIDMRCIGSVNRWCRYFNVTRIQLEIATSRVGTDPAAVARELGLGERFSGQYVPVMLHDAA